MVTEVKLPQFGMGMSEATVVRWYKNVGDHVTKGEPLLEVEAAKSMNEIAAPVSGVLTGIAAHAEQVVQVYEVIAFIGDAGDTVPETTPTAEPPVSKTIEIDGSSEDAAPAAGGVSGGENATPRARRLARELGVDLATVKGTGSGGRITDEDVERALPYLPGAG